MCAYVSKMTGGAVRQPQECDKNTKDFSKVKVEEEKNKGIAGSDCLHHPPDHILLPLGHCVCVCLSF